MPTEAQKKASIKWRQTHREQYRRITLNTFMYIEINGMVTITKLKDLEKFY